MTEQARKDFETVALVLAAKHYRYANADAALLETLFERRTNGTYAVDWVDGAWIGYQAGRESVAVTLPFLFPAYRQEVVAAIEAAGGTVKA